MPTTYARPDPSLVSRPPLRTDNLDDATPADRERALDGSLVGGLAWTGAARWLAQALSWASTIIVARLLTRTDYGIYGAAVVYLGIVQLVNEFGLGAAVVRDRGLDENRRASLGGLSVALGVLFFGLSVAVAAPIASFYHEPAVTKVIMVLALNFAVTGFRTLPNALLAQDQDFRRLARIDWTESLVQTATTLALAIIGYRYWSLVIGSVVAAVVGTIMTVAARPHRLAWPRDFKPILDPLLTGWHITLSRVGWYAYSNADFLIVGRILGTQALGAYTFAWQIASIPVDKTSGILSRVTLPVFARVQDDAAALRRYVRGLSEGLALITFPLSFGMALVGDKFVRFALGDHWVAAIGPLRLLALYAGVRSLMTLFPQVLIAMGRVRWNMWLSLLLAIVMPTAFFVGTRWGVSGVAMAWVVAYPLVAIPLLVVYTLRAIGLTLPGYLRALWPAFSATAVMTAAVLGASSLVPGTWGRASTLAVEVGAGAAAYCAAVYFGHAGRVKAFFEMVRTTRR